MSRKMNTIGPNQERLQNLFKRLNQLNVNSTDDQGKQVKVERLDIAIVDLESMILA